MSHPRASARVARVALVALSLSALVTLLASGPAHAMVSAAASTTAALAPSEAATPAPSVIVVGIPGLRWDAADPVTTPALWRLAERGGLGALSIKAAPDRTCPADGWATVGAGNRAQGLARSSETCPPLPTEPPDEATLDGVRRATARLDSGARLGALGTALERAGRCVTTVGPLARYAVPDPRRSVAAVDRLTAADLATCPATVVDGRSDADLAAVERLRPPGSLLLVVGVSSLGSEAPRLHVALADGPGFPSRALVSASTRRAPYVQLLDVAPTVLAALGIERPAAMIGQPMRAAGSPLRGAGRAPFATAERINSLVDLDLAAVRSGGAIVPFFALLAALLVALLFLTAATVHRPAKTSRQQRLRTLTRTLTLTAGAAPAATFLANLVPWWRAGSPLLAVLAAVAVADAALVAMALAGPWRRHPLGPPGAVAALTALVIAVDLATGARLQMSSLAGYSPLVAGRFAGIGNVAFGIFGASAILAAASLAGAARTRRTALLAIAAAGLPAVIVDGAPTLGSDVGGVLALVAAFAVLGLLVAGVRLSAARLGIIAAAAVAAVAALALLDYARPAADQTHLGRFVGQVLHGGAGDVVRRKATANARLLTRSPLTLLVPLGTALVGWALLRPLPLLRRAFERAPQLRAGALATLVLALVGFAVNDSGVAVPPMAGSVLVPLLLAAALSAEPADPARDARPGPASDALPSG